MFHMTPIFVAAQSRSSAIFWCADTPLRISLSTGVDKDSIPGWIIATPPRAIVSTSARVRFDFTS